MSETLFCNCNCISDYNFSCKVSQLQLNSRKAPLADFTSCNPRYKCNSWLRSFHITIKPLFSQWPSYNGSYASSTLSCAANCNLYLFVQLQPAAGTKIQGKGVIICKFPNDPTVSLGGLSIVALLISAALGVIAVFYPYKGQSVPKDALFRSTSLTVFMGVAV